MYSASPLPAAGEAFLDARGGQRALRVSWHPEEGVVVLSVWRETVCVATFRLPVEDVPGMIDVLRAGLAEAYADAPRAHGSAHHPGGRHVGGYHPGHRSGGHLAG
ncbi:MAG TPA: hypothetical protein VF049_12440 [Nocardioidaceae bacterium]|jgi:hypothetical protein